MSDSNKKCSFEIDGDCLKMTPQAMVLLLAWIEDLEGNSHYTNAELWSVYDLMYQLREKVATLPMPLEQYRDDPNKVVDSKPIAHHLKEFLQKKRDEFHNEVSENDQLQEFLFKEIIEGQNE